MSPRSSDYREYKTVLQPQLFQIEWEPFYRDALDASNALKQRYRNVSDLSYGPSQFQTLDLYLPDQVGPQTPCLVFLHGGAFREGHPAQYGFVGKPYLERGIAFISAGYRLAPESFYPDHVQDVADLMQWLHASLPQYGLSTRRLVLSGHSSGALMIALASVRSDWQSPRGMPVDILDSVVLAGANYDHRPDFPQNLVQDPSRRDEGTVVCNLSRVPGRAIIVFGVDERNTGDGGRFERSGRPLGAAFQSAGSDVRVHALETDHQGTCNALCDVNSETFADILQSLETVGRQSDR